MINLKPIFAFILLFVGLYALAVFPVAPWLLGIVIGGALLLWKGDVILGWLAKISSRKRRLEEKPIEIPESVPPTVELPKKEELKKMAVDKMIDYMYNIMSQQNKIIVQQNATISELRGKLENTMRQMEETKKRSEMLQKWIGAKDERELMKKLLQLGYASYLYGVPVVTKDGKKLGTFVALVPNPVSPEGGLLCLVQNAYGQIVPAGWGQTVADPRYFPVFDPENFQEIMRELREYGSYFLEGGKAMRFGDIMDHALVLSQYATKAPAYIDEYAELSFPKQDPQVRMAVVKDADAAAVIYEQRNRIEQMRMEIERLRFENEELQREVDYLRTVAATALQRLAVRESPDRFLSTLPTVEDYLREAERADTHRRVLADIQTVRDEEQEYREKYIKAKMEEYEKLAGSTTLEVTRRTLEEAQRMLALIKGPKEELIKAMSKALEVSEKRQEEVRRAEVGGTSQGV
ncbi:hypothetical protein [Candidatus Methanodesulfokora washburnensis]|uniref:Uncharacterized protein n=1 Tax=Candidatus Methanodesulfokora washburnensis TaxID=2478471 RepID=A0A3R9PG39_9CREN|nr:hypothetical protein [Candidatus Methanodesulfokores washburnensis]RSN72475.1 hypothetical protein D6D85_13775 [Candidatus Methanodesulfokores washburnensis]